VDFLTRYQYRKAELKISLEDKAGMIERAIRLRNQMEIVYLKPDDTKSRRTIQPLSIGEMSYKGKSYLGLRAFCLTRQEERTFRVDRILELEVLE